MRNVGLTRSPHLSAYDIQPMPARDPNVVRAGITVREPDFFFMAVTNASSSSASPVADPGPLGLAAFALTTFILSSANAGLLPKGADAVMFGLAFGYGGLVQLLAGMWEFRRNNTFAATAFSSYGGFWIAFALLVTFFIGKIPPDSVPASLGIFLFSWAIFTTYMTIAARGASKPVFVVFLLLTPTFFALAIGAWASIPTLTVVGGYLGILTALVAWYASATVVIASTKKA